MYSSRSNLILGFHGCEESEMVKLISDSSYLRSSTESYDWLGHGMYFWEYNPLRAQLWAEQKKKAGNLKNPAVVGAVLELGRCLDLLDSINIELVKKSYELFKSESTKLNKPIPVNEDHPRTPGKDKVLRYLDCAIIEYAHAFLRNKNEPSFDSVRAAFIEGDPIYPGAGFNEKTHIQICIINPYCIKGLFKPRERVL